MSPKGYLVLAALGAFGMAAAFALFIYSMVAGDIFGTESLTDIILNILMFLGILMLSMAVMVVCLIKYLKNKDGVNVVPTKRCPSCGTEMGVTEMSCPRCFTLQPADEKHRYR